MSIQVRIPTPLRGLTKEQEVVEASGATVADLIANLDSQYNGIRERICEDDGKIRRFVNIFVNDEDIRFLDDVQTALKEGDDVSILPAIAGG